MNGNLDAADRGIVALLQSDAKLTYEQLGGSVGLSPAAAFQRVRKLEQAGVLRGYHARADAAALGRPVLAFVRVNPGPGTDIDRLLRSWESAAEIQECYAVSGSSAYVLKVSLRSVQELGPHLDHARRAGCAVSSELVMATAFERWAVPVS